MATVLITGGTGLIGTALVQALVQKNYQVIILSRKPVANPPITSPVSYAQWNIQAQTIDTRAIARADYIIHLAGAGIADKRWTKTRKQQIIDSRVKSSELLIKKLREIDNPVKAIISASAIGWYGADPVIPNPDPFTEDASASKDYLGSVCSQWEKSIEPVAMLGKRLVKLRTGIVLSNKGGAMKEFEKPLKFGIAAILGNGKQIISWIHIEDLVRLYIAAIEDQRMNGVYNAVSPNPVSNKEFTLQFAKAKRSRFFVPIHIPSFIIKLALGEMSIEALKSATVSCNRILYSGFDFRYPSITTALANISHN